KIKDNQSGLIDKLISQDKSKIEYRHESVVYNNLNASLIIQEFKVPEYYLDKPLKLEFKDVNQFTLTYKDEVVFNGL
ncbi:tyrosine protein kinase, partial [Acinetobacter baumannii]